MTAYICEWNHLAFSQNGRALKLLCQFWNVFENILFWWVTVHDWLAWGCCQSHIDIWNDDVLTHPQGWPFFQQDTHSHSCYSFKLSELNFLLCLLVITVMIFDYYLVITFFRKCLYKSKYWNVFVYLLLFVDLGIIAGIGEWESLSIPPQSLNVIQFPFLEIIFTLNEKYFYLFVVVLDLGSLAELGERETPLISPQDRNVI